MGNKHSNKQLKCNNCIGPKPININYDKIYLPEPNNNESYSKYINRLLIYIYNFLDINFPPYIQFNKKYSEWTNPLNKNILSKIHKNILNEITDNYIVEEYDIINTNDIEKIDRIKNTILKYIYEYINYLYNSNNNNIQFLRKLGYVSLLLNRFCSDNIYLSDNQKLINIYNQPSFLQYCKCYNE